jgi:Putative esterase
MPTISPATAQADGSLMHVVSSPYQQGEVKIHVLLPDAHCADTGCDVLFLLPVEPHDGRYCGDVLREVCAQQLHQHHRLIYVKPTFSHPPWYADHPSDPGIRQESHFLHVVLPFIDRTYCGPSGPSRRLLVGFSKSGWGAFSLLLRHPDLFDKAAVFDAPLAWESPNRYGMGEVFETQANLDRYCIVDLLPTKVEQLRARSRLALFGYSDFRGHHQYVHYQMLKLDIPHAYEDGPRRDHTWDSGWLPAAVEFLAADPVG